MPKELDLPHVDYEGLAGSLGEVFINRWDVYARQLDDGSYICVHEPFGMQEVVSHLKGDITLGIYLLDHQNQSRYIVFDADNQDEMEHLLFIANRLTDHDVVAYLEESRRGGHLWLFFETPKPGRDARLFGQGILSWRSQSTLELFPKQDQLTTGPGSLIRLPFGIHRKSGERYGFIDLDGHPLASSMVDQIELLSHPEPVPNTAFDTFWINGQFHQKEQEKMERPSNAGTVSQRIKNSISAYDFIHQYVELSPRGKGLCPFHDDHTASFSVNLEGNYWHCFAGCGGGSIIDFWMKWRDCDFIPAVTELAHMLLNE